MQIIWKAAFSPNYSGALYFVLLLELPWYFFVIVVTSTGFKMFALFSFKKSEKHVIFMDWDTSLRMTWSLFQGQRNANVQLLKIHCYVVITTVLYCSYSMKLYIYSWKKAFCKTQISTYRNMFSFQGWI